MKLRRQERGLEAASCHEFAQNASRPVDLNDATLNRTDARVPRRQPQDSRTSRSALLAFTMVEIAICLAVIGFALVAIIGVLPSAMNFQRDNREETIIDQDATYWMEALRGGIKGLDDLPNHVEKITVLSTNRLPNGDPIPLVMPDGISGIYQPGAEGIVGAHKYETGFDLIGLLGVASWGDMNDPIARAGPVSAVEAEVRAISGPAVERDPDNELGLKYRLRVEITPFNADAKLIEPAWPPEEWPDQFNNQVAMLYEVRLEFNWLLRSGGSSSPRFRSSKTYRTFIQGTRWREPGTDLLTFFEP